MAYDAQVSITVPAILADIAAKVGKGFDPDLAGEKSFSPVIAGYNADETPIYSGNINVTTRCTAQFKGQADYLMTNPQALHDALAADYANRWTELTPPTLAECTLFCNSIIV